MSDQPQAPDWPFHPPLPPVMSPQKARDVARRWKWMADSFLADNMRSQATLMLRESEWWLGYALTLEATKHDDGQ